MAAASIAPTAVSAAMSRQGAPSSSAAAQLPLRPAVVRRLHLRSQRTLPSNSTWSCRGRVAGAQAGRRRGAVRCEADTSKTPAPPACEPGKTTLGFVGMGIMGVPMALNLVRAGYSVVVWNRSTAKCVPLKEAGAVVARSPAEVARQSDVVFGMLSDPFAAYSVACRPGGVVEGLCEGKGYVDVSTVDPFTARQIQDGVRAAGAQFLEAPVSGSKGPAEQGQLIFLTAGTRELYDRVAHPLEVMGKASFYLGDVGKGANMKLVVNMIMGSMMAAFSEGMALAERTGLSQQDLLDVVSLGAIASPMFALKGPAMMEGSFPAAFPLKHQAKDLRLALEVAELMEAELPVSDATLGAYERAERLGLGEQDFSAVLRALQTDTRAERLDPRELAADDAEFDYDGFYEEED
mmetsp:Transcript_13682/g.35150  ORF Transcript_13682/g.35150 Transcript_13682/m.35150 type:complete len:406 (+) Transcript_13682:156-1373(+)